MKFCINKQVKNHLCISFVTIISNMKYLSVLILITIGFLYGCGKEEKPYVPIQRCPDLTRNMDSISKYIHGTWEWVEEKRYERNKNDYVYYTPNSPIRNER